MRAAAVASSCLIAVLGAATATGCVDVREHEGTWIGERVGDAPALRVGMADQVSATLQVEEATLRTFRGRLTTSDDVFQDALIQPLAGAEADVLGGTTFSGSPLKVYFAFAATSDGGGDALAVVALYAGPRIEARIMRGGTSPLYGIFRFDRRQ